MIPIGLNLTSIGVSSRWWLESARLAEQAGFSGVYCWDHHISQGADKTRPVLECWTTLTPVGSFVTNVMNRHPAILARMLATLAGQSGPRVDLGIGVGGNADEMAAYGIRFPDPPERIAILEEALAVMRALWKGGPADYDGHFFQLHQAYAHPAPEPPPRIIVGGEKPAGARLAARVGDGWTTNAPDYAELLPIHLAELEAHGRKRSDVIHVVAVPLTRDEPLESNRLIADMSAFADEWQARGADELIVNWVRPAHLQAVIDAADKAGLASSNSH